MKRLGAQTYMLILLALLLGLGHAFVFASTVTATYIPENPVYFTQSPGAFTHESIAGAKLGTIIMSSDGPIYNPGLMTIGDFKAGSGISMSLEYNWGGDTYSRGEKPFYVVVVAYPYGRGGTPYVTTPYNNQWPIMGKERSTNVTITVSPFYVDLYLININPGSTTDPGSVVATNPPAYYIKPKSAITFASPFNPTFSVGVGSSAEKGVYDYAQGPSGALTPGTSNGSYVAVDGIAGPDSTPLIDPNGFTGSTGSDNGYWFDTGVQQELNFLFSFLENTTSFTLSDAYGTNKKAINTAQMIVQNGETGTTYAQKLTFTDSTTDSSFQLRATSGIGLPIDFKLYFGETEIVKGSSFTWGGLASGENTKELKVGGINATLAGQRVSGAYTDTITVNITAVD